jgi:transposase IS200 family protein
VDHSLEPTSGELTRPPRDDLKLESARAKYMQNEIPFIRVVDYMLKVASKRGFALEEVSVLPDHVHLLVKLPPKISIENCALSLMNNSQQLAGTVLHDSAYPGGGR